MLLVFITQVYQEAQSREREIYRRNFFHLFRNYIARVLCWAADLHLAGGRCSVRPIQNPSVQMSDTVLGPQVQEIYRKCKMFLV